MCINKKRFFVGTEIILLPEYDKEFKMFLNIAQGSISELDTQIELALMPEYINGNLFEELIDKG
jgi:four helix bundle protein